MTYLGQGSTQRGDVEIGQVALGFLDGQRDEEEEGRQQRRDRRQGRRWCGGSGGMVVVGSGSGGRGRGGGVGGLGRKEGEEGAGPVVEVVQSRGSDQAVYMESSGGKHTSNESRLLSLQGSGGMIRVSEPRHSTTTTATRVPGECVKGRHQIGPRWGPG